MLLNPRQKERAVDRTIDGQWCNKALNSQSSEKRRCFPTPSRHAFDHSRAALRATVGASHVGLGPRLVDED